MTLGGKVHDCVDIFVFEDVIQKVGRPDIAFHKIDVWERLNFSQIFQTRAVIKLVKNSYLSHLKQKGQSYVS